MKSKVYTTNSKQLQKIIEAVFDVNLLDKSRRREIVEARIAYSNILHEVNNLTISAIAKTLGKNHATVIHYLKHFHYIQMDNELWNKYLQCYNSYTEKAHPVHDMELQKCKNYVYSLENKINVLTLNINRLKNEQEKFNIMNEEYAPLYKLIKERVKPQQVEQVTRRLNTYLNGI